MTAPILGPSRVKFGDPGDRLRRATAHDAPALARLIERSVRGLQAADYSATQLDAALGYVFGVDHQLIADGTYIVIERGDAICACGGWSRRRTLFGAQAHAVRDDSLLTPGEDAAKIRAFFVDPDHARQGLGGRLLTACEAAAHAEGYRTLELGATLTGEPLYRRYGYRETDRYDTPLPGGGGLTIVRMVKPLAPTFAAVVEHDGAKLGAASCGS